MSQVPGRLPIPCTATAFVTSKVSTKLLPSALSSHTAICGPRSGCRGSKTQAPSAGARKQSGWNV